MSEERLQKVLARAGLGSRRQIEEMIREERIAINGRLATLGDRADLAVDSVKVDGRRIQHVEVAMKYLLVNKPSGYVSTVQDPEGRRTVVELVPQRLRHGIVPVGRLDYETEGLLILTNDGDFSHRVAHPRFGCSKTYEAKVKGYPTEREIERLRRGILLEGRRTAPAEITAFTETLGQRIAKKSTWWTVVLKEGRPRQVREMFFRIGHPVRRLRRVAIGSLRDTKLPVGGCRELTEEEVEALRNPQATPKKPAKRPVGSAVAGAKKNPAARGITARGRSTNSRAKSTRATRGQAKKGKPQKAQGGSRTTAKAGPTKGLGQGRSGKGPAKTGGPRSSQGPAKTGGPRSSQGPAKTGGPRPSQGPAKGSGPRRERSKPSSTSGGRPRSGGGPRGGGRGRG